MELRQYFQTVWKWLWLILVCTLCAGITSFIVSSLMPPVYEARVVLMSNQSTSTGMIDYASLLGGQQVIETYRELLKTRPVLEAVIASLDLPYSPKELEKRIEVSIIPNTQLLALRVENNDPQLAADIANEIILSFMLQRSAEQQLQEIEYHEKSVVTQIRDLEQAIERTEADVEQARASSGLLTREELAQMQANLSQQQATYASLLSGYLNIRTMKSRFLDLVVVEPASPPKETVRPRKVLNTAVAAVGGCMIACALAFLLEYLNDTLENDNDVRETLSLPSLGAIPFVKAWHKNGQAPIQEEERPLLEAFRILRTNIQFVNVDSTAHTLLVTSSVPREGKTIVVINLGTVMAQNGRKVLLVDADLRRPRLHQAFRVQNLEGLTSLILQDIDPTECVVGTDISNLYVLPSGPIPPNPAELLGSQRMAQLTEEFQSFADVVLFDVPPVLACADAMVLASRVDGVVLVIDSRSTRRETALRALEMLRSVEAKVLGGVLNKASVRSSAYYYYYSNDGEPKKHFWTRWRGRDGYNRRAQRAEKLDR